MGNRSTKYIKRYEYQASLHQIDLMLEDLKQQQNTDSSELKSTLRRIKDDLSSLQTRQKDQIGDLNTTEKQVKVNSTDFTKQLDDLRMTLNTIATEHKADQIRFPEYISKEVTQQRKKWSEDVDQLRERMEEIKKYSMELVSMDLAHEREIKDLQKRICYLEDNIMPSIPSETKLCTNLFQKTSETPLKLITSCKECGLEGGKTIVDPKASYAVKLSKIDMAMRKLRGEIRLAEVKRIKSSAIDVEM